MNEYLRIVRDTIACQGRKMTPAQYLEFLGDCKEEINILISATEEMISVEGDRDVKL